LSRDMAAALLSDEAPTQVGLNRLLERQLAEARAAGGELDVGVLLRSVSEHYDRIDGERRGIVRSMRLMSDEAQALTREIREETASHLQAILDNVKDAILTVDEGGHIETFNPTGERIFGYSPVEIFGRPSSRRAVSWNSSTSAPPRSRTPTSISPPIMPGV
jgi:PAS domain-containing protein